MGWYTREGAIGAVPTEYRGWQMRSRLEARTAVALDGMGLEWKYEPGHNWPGLRYAPDFGVWLDADTPVWWEVKPEEYPRDTYRPWTAMARQSGLPVLVTYGVGSWQATNPFNWTEGLPPMKVIGATADSLRVIRRVLGSEDAARAWELARNARFEEELVA